MGKTEQYIEDLNKSNDWIAYLKKNSALPGKRANLELLFAVMDLGDEKFFNKCLAFNEQIAPTNTPGEFIAACGTVGLGTLICRDKLKYWDILKRQTSDARWRVREGVAFGLQKIGEEDFDLLIKNLADWKNGNPFEKRAVVAGICEPVLLKKNLTLKLF